MAGEFKPNIYPIMYWGLLYGLVAGFILLILFFLSRYITMVWFPVFLAGVIYGGYRNYLKQRREAGQPHGTGSPLEEFKEAAGDIVQATKEMIREQTADAENEPELTGEEVAEPVFPETPAPRPPALPTPRATESEASKPENNEAKDAGQGPVGPPT